MQQTDSLPEVQRPSDFPSFLSQKLPKKNGNRPIHCPNFQIDPLAAKLLDQMQEAVCIVTSSLNVYYWNQGMEKFSGVSKSEAIGSPLFELLPNSFQAQLHDKFAPILEGQKNQKGEITYRFQNNDIFAFCYQISPYPESNGQPLALFSLEDITDRYRLQIEKEKQEHLAALAILSVGVAQELTNPLDQVCHYVDNVLKSLNSYGDQRFQKHLRGIISQVYRISYLAHNLVALTQQTPPGFASLNINEIILEAIESWEQDNSHKPVINLNFADNLPSVAGDPILMQSAMQTLVRISVDFAGDDAVPRIQTFLKKPSDKVAIIFEDRGPALPAQELEHLFELYHGSTFISPGASLGLFISKKVIEAQKGTFHISSQKGRGTVIEIYLPVLA